MVIYFAAQPAKKKDCKHCNEISFAMQYYSTPPKEDIAMLFSKVMSYCKPVEEDSAMLFPKVTSCSPIWYLILHHLKKTVQCCSLRWYLVPWGDILFYTSRRRHCITFTNVRNVWNAWNVWNVWNVTPKVIYSSSTCEEDIAVKTRYIIDYSIVLH